MSDSGKLRLSPLVTPSVSGEGVSEHQLGVSTALSTQLLCMEKTININYAVVTAHARSSIKCKMFRPQVYI